MNIQPRSQSKSILSLIPENQRNGEAFVECKQKKNLL